jgi:predicted nucleic-acid-binding protein
VRAIDTNIVVRFLMADDRKQSHAARAAVSAGEIFIPTTVLLESEWVLRSGYGFTVDQIAHGLRGLAGLPGITLEEPMAVAQALTWMVEGMDFADALHLAKSQQCSVFLTFDRKLVKAAKARSTIAVEMP